MFTSGCHSHPHWAQWQKGHKPVFVHLNRTIDRPEASAQRGTTYHMSKYLAFINQQMLIYLTNFIYLTNVKVWSSLLPQPTAKLSHDLIGHGLTPQSPAEICWRGESMTFQDHFPSFFLLPLWGADLMSVALRPLLMPGNVCTDGSSVLERADLGKRPVQPWKWSWGLLGWECWSPGLLAHGFDYPDISFCREGHSGRTAKGSLWSSYPSFILVSVV